MPKHYVALIWVGIEAHILPVRLAAYRNTSHRHEQERRSFPSTLSVSAKPQRRLPIPAPYQISPNFNSSGHRWVVGFYAPTGLGYSDGNRH